jgi:hypothetical protein
MRKLVNFPSPELARTFHFYENFVSVRHWVAASYLQGLPSPAQPSARYLFRMLDLIKTIFQCLVCGQT